MVVFYINAPFKNNNGTLAGGEYVIPIFRKESAVNKDYIDKIFTYTQKFYNQSHTFRVKVEIVSTEKVKELKKLNLATYQYDWIVDSIVEHGKIIMPKDFAAQEGTDAQKITAKIYKIVNSGTPNKEFTTIKDMRIHNYKLQELINAGLISESDEIYSGGPTVAKMLTFMNKNHVWDGGPYLHVDFNNGKFIYTSIHTNEITPDEEAVLDNMLPGCTKDKYRSDGGQWYFK